VKERQEWLGRVRDADGCQRWIKAVDLRPANNSQP
jgi:SH3-like domain-containing protein